MLPYPHGYNAAPIAEGPQARLLAGLGCRVNTFIEEAQRFGEEVRRFLAALQENL